MTGSRRRHPLGRAPGVVLLALLTPVSAGAQVWIGRDAPRRGSVEIGAGGVWTAGQDVTAQNALLTENLSTQTGSFELFGMDASLEQAIGGRATLAYYVSRAVSLEAGVQYSRPELRVRLGRDFEGAPDVTAATTITRYLFTGSLLYHFASGRQVTPFVGAGAGHVRDVHAGNELVETGVEFHGTGGVKVRFGRGRRTFGIRAEAGVSVIDGGFTFEEGRRTSPSASASLTYLF